MQLEEIRGRIDQIILAACRGDDPSAHEQEDQLYANVLRAIAAGDCESPQKAAALVLTTEEIAFSRWYE